MLSNSKLILPNKVSDLLDATLVSQLTGKKVKKVEYSERLEQHANSTDRAWFKLTFENPNQRTKGKDEEAFVFAKVQAKTLLVRAMLSIFDVYRNELDAYKNCERRFQEIGVMIPKVYCAEWSSSRFVLMMEDLRKKEQSVEFPNIWEKDITKERAKGVLSTLARMHAGFWGENVPKGCWNDKTRPYKGKVVGMITLYRVNKILPGLIPPEVSKVFTQALWNWDIVRDFWSRSQPKTMCHGDTHFGNFYILNGGKKDEKIGTFDFQCKDEEHPMRDVTYFLISTYPENKLAADEKELIEFYLSKLKEFLPENKKSETPTFDNAWLQYRMQSYYSLYAFIFSGGFSDLMDPHQTEVGLKRIVKQFQRVDATGALYDLLDGKI